MIMHVNYLLTEKEVFTGKAQTKTLLMPRFEIFP